MAINLDSRSFLQRVSASGITTPAKFLNHRIDLAEEGQRRKIAALEPFLKPQGCWNQEKIRVCVCATTAITWGTIASTAVGRKTRASAWVLSLSVEPTIEIREPASLEIFVGGGV